MWIGHRKEIQKLFRISLRWPIHIINQTAPKHEHHSFFRYLPLTCDQTSLLFFLGGEKKDAWSQVTYPLYSLIMSYANVIRLDLRTTDNVSGSKVKQRGPVSPLSTRFSSIFRRSCSLCTGSPLIKWS